MSESQYSSHFRLSRSDAIRVVTELNDLSIEQAEGLATLNHPKAYPPPISRPVFDRPRLKELRDLSVSLAEKYGFPRVHSEKSTAFSQFDAELGNLLLTTLNMTPAEAGVEEVWNFLTLIVVPDLAKWRFTNQTKNPQYERWIGRPRNVLRKAWWRAYCLGPELNLTIGEDEGVGLMERPTFGYNPTIAKSIIKIHNDRCSEVELARSEVLRLAMVQMSRLSSIINLDVLSESQVDQLVNEAYQITIDKVLDLQSQSMN